MRVWLKRKLAECIDGVDLRDYCVGDTLELSTREACLLVAEEWAASDRRLSPDRRIIDIRPPHSERRVFHADAHSQVEAPAADRETADPSYQRKDGRVDSQPSSRRR
jgi:hypothetical protein